MTKFPFIDQYMKGYSAFEVHYCRLLYKLVTIALVEPLPNNACYFHAIETIPAFRCQGMARMIINDLKKEYDMIYLNAVPELDSYYKCNGFTELQIGGGYYVWMRNPK